MKIVKEISIFVVGAALGVVGSWKYMETKYQTIADEEIESMKKMVRNNRRKAVVGDSLYNGISDAETSMKAPESDSKALLDDCDIVAPNEVSRSEKTPMSDKARRLKDDETIATTSGIGKTYTDMANKYKAAGPGGINSTQKTNYKAMSDTEFDEVDENEIESNERIHSVGPIDPIIISDISFVEDCLDYDKITINFYAIDKVVTDDDNLPMNDYVDCIGHEALTSFGKLGNPDNLVYVRNDKLEIDYEVIKFDESYA